MPGPIGESSIKGERLRIPKAVKLYLKLTGNEKVEWLPNTADLTPEELMDNCVILHVVRKK